MTSQGKHALICLVRILFLHFNIRFHVDPRACHAVFVLFVDFACGFLISETGRGKSSGGESVPDVVLEAGDEAGFKDQKDTQSPLTTKTNPSP